MTAQGNHNLAISGSGAVDGEVLAQLNPEELIALDASTNKTHHIPAHASPRPSGSKDNIKRCDPFQFGSRYLQSADDVFEFNAWDNVETDDTYKEYAEIQYAKQREAPVSDFDMSMSAFSIF
jgi:tRNAThr (cytosine32-N3)-methyltransferase